MSDTQDYANKGGVARKCSCNDVIMDFSLVLAYTLVRAADLLLEADGYSEGDEVDLPECLVFVVTKELLRRHLVRCPQTVSYPLGNFLIRLSLEGTLVLGKNGMPGSYQAYKLRKDAHFRDLSVLLPEHFASVVAHTIGVLYRYLEEVYDFESSYRIVHLIPVLQVLSEGVERQHLEDAYQAEFLLVEPR